MEAKATGEPQTLPVEDPPAESKEEEINSSVPSPITVDEVIKVMRLSYNFLLLK
ncbi:UNVERIFIED_CONTAM: hypothetical protein Sradi_4576400 [Sesamum radiatum]|uniref:Uncharacterized protein n=1 Tax=Sesamum radiatum TaxID=300843 RepID=A0AAW2NDX3_SESRA